MTEAGRDEFGKYWSALSQDERNKLWPCLQALTKGFYAGFDRAYQAGRESIRDERCICVACEDHDAGIKRARALPAGPRKEG